MRQQILTLALGLFSTRLPSPMGAGVLPEQSKCPSIEFPEIDRPPVLPDAFTLPPTSLFRISKAERFFVSDTLPRISVFSMLLLSPTSSSSLRLPSIRLPSMATKSARLASRLPRISTSRAISEPPEKSVTLPLTSVPVSWQGAAISRLPRTSTSPRAFAAVSLLRGSPEPVEGGNDKDAREWPAMVQHSKSWCVSQIYMQKMRRLSLVVASRWPDHPVRTTWQRDPRFGGVLFSAALRPVCGTTQSATGFLFH